MRIERATAKKDDLQAEVHSIFRLARVFHHDHARILKSLKDRVYRSKDYDRIPRWAKSEVRGYIDAQFVALNDYCLEWRVRLNGELVDGDNVPSGRWHEVDKGATVWSDNGDIYFDSE